VHVIHIRLRGPIDCFSAELDIWKFLEKILGRPFSEHGPLFDWGGEDEGFVGPVLGVVIGRQIVKSGNGVGLGNVADKRIEGRVNALEGTVKDVREEVAAGDGGDVRAGNVEVGRAPGAAPCEVGGRRAGDVVSSAYRYV
jgi:hypothetical protein